MRCVLIVALCLLVAAGIFGCDKGEKAEEPDGISVEKPAEMPVVEETTEPAKTGTLRSQAEPVCSIRGSDVSNINDTAMTLYPPFLEFTKKKNSVGVLVLARNIEMTRPPLKFCIGDRSAFR